MKNISREEYPRFELLYDLLWDTEEIHEQYDAVLIDPNARAEDLSITRSTHSEHS